MLGQSRDIFARDLHLSVVGRVDSADKVQQRRFSRSASSSQSDCFPVCKFCIQVAKYMMLPGTLLETPGEI
jgi:hypothetical protein